MFSIRFRNVALALAGAALAATSLMTPVLAATPSPHMTVEDSTRFTVPVTDIQVTRVAAVGTGGAGERAWATFEVKNIGQQPMTFELATSWTSRRIADDSYHPHPANQNMTLAAGDAKQVTLRCDLPNAQYECYYFIAQARNLKGLDSNMSNNGADFQP